MLFFYLKKILQKIKKYGGTVFFLFIIGVLIWNRTYFLTYFGNVGLTLRETHFVFVFLSIIIHLFNHLLRALRWKFLLGANYQLSLWRLFEAEMVGFCSNIFVPRSGDIVRCRLLLSFSRVPFRSGFSSVIAERSIDIFFFFLQFLLLILLLFITQGTAIKAFSLRDFFAIPFFSYIKVFFVLRYNLFFFFVLTLSALLFFLYRLGYTGFLTKAFASVKNFLRHTLASIKRAFSKERSNILLTSLAIWGSYFLVEYLCLKALNATAKLGLLAIFILFISINIATCIPLPGNVGGYHVLVTGVLISLGIAQKEALTYATLTHGVQFFNAFVIGGLLSLHVQWKMRRKKVE